MKTLKRILFMSAAVVLFSTVNSNAQIVVRARLYHRGPVVVRPARPSVNHVWIENEWVPRGRTYVERPGYWAVATPAARRYGYPAIGTVATEVISGCQDFGDNIISLRGACSEEQAFFCFQGKTIG